jgi:hypothetical protein
MKITTQSASSADVQNAWIFTSMNLIYLYTVVLGYVGKHSLLMCYCVFHALGPLACSGSELTSETINHPTARPLCIQDNTMQKMETYIHASSKI